MANGQKVIFKFDDMTCMYNADTDKLTAIANLFIARNVKATWGTYNLDNATQRNIDEVKKWIYNPLFEIFNHGQEHDQNVPNAGDYEFKGTTYEHQRARFEQAQSLNLSLFGVTPKSFGAPFNQTDATTVQMLNDVGQTKIVMFSSADFSGTSIRNISERPVDIESPTGVLNYANFVTKYNTAKTSSPNVMILQGHPAMWSDYSQLVQILDFLDAEKVNYVLPTEYYESTIKAWSVGTQLQFDSIPLKPTLDTSNCGIIFNSNFGLASGDYSDCECKFKALTSVKLRRFHEAGFGATPRFVRGSAIGSNKIDDNLTSAINNNNVKTDYFNYRISATGSCFVGSFHNSSIQTTETITSDMRIVQGGVVTWKWLDQISDYKSIPPNATISGTAVWGKKGIEGNYLTPELAVSAITATNPTEPVVIYILDRSTDVSGIPATINGQSVIVDYSFAPVKNISFHYGYRLGY